MDSLQTKIKECKCEDCGMDITNANNENCVAGGFHSQTESEEEHKKVCIEYFQHGNCEHLDPVILDLPPKTESEEWEKMLYELCGAEKLGNVYTTKKPLDFETAKGFIMVILSSHSKKLVSELKRKIIEMPIYHTLKIEDEEYQLISKVDVINIIKM